eukprot:gnl/TRDRNA2_/TRDRNA2_125338_c0_seq1.p1 gnl/TRDRNA2_/TRDRNA2_125338_c0~~gnl/TRDRNA2_/TRDRNA2_125338_c0_seq1.p1  ORF type:complete len:727 (-),score=159.85 gnl/TRDRNA2_/TRDRNA2_125338_c0_seq1:50-2230(-)
MAQQIKMKVKNTFIDGVHIDDEAEVSAGQQRRGFRSLPVDLDFDKHTGYTETDSEEADEQELDCADDVINTNDLKAALQAERGLPEAHDDANGTLSAAKLKVKNTFIEYEDSGVAGDETPAPARRTYRTCPDLETQIAEAESEAPPPAAPAPYPALLTCDRSAEGRLPAHKVAGMKVKNTFLCPDEDKTPANCRSQTCPAERLFEESSASSDDPCPATRTLSDGGASVESAEEDAPRYVSARDRRRGFDTQDLRECYANDEFAFTSDDLPLPARPISKPCSAQAKSREATPARSTRGRHVSFAAVETSPTAQANEDGADDTPPRRRAGRRDFDTIDLQEEEGLIGNRVAQTPPPPATPPPPPPPPTAADQDAIPVRFGKASPGEKVPVLLSPSNENSTDPSPTASGTMPRAAAGVAPPPMVMMGYPPMAPGMMPPPWPYTAAMYPGMMPPMMMPAPVMPPGLMMQPPAGMYPGWPYPGMIPFATPTSSPTNKAGAAPPPPPPAPGLWEAMYPPPAPAPPKDNSLSRFFPDLDKMVMQSPPMEAAEEPAATGQTGILQPGLVGECPSGGKREPRGVGRRALRLWCHIYLHMVHPNFDLVPMLIGRGGGNMRKIYEATGSKIRVRGRGSGHLEVDGGREAPTPLMVAVTSDQDNHAGFKESIRMTLIELRNVEKRFKAFCTKEQIAFEGPAFSIGLLPDEAGTYLGDVLEGVPFAGSGGRKMAPAVDA